MRGWPLSLGLAVAFILVIAQLLGPLGFIGASAVAFLAVVWRHDNDLGTCLPLAVLFLIALGILAFVLVITRMIHGG